MGSPSHIHRRGLTAIDYHVVSLLLCMVLWTPLLLSHIAYPNISLHFCPWNVKRHTTRWVVPPSASSLLSQEPVRRVSVGCGCMACWDVNTGYHGSGWG